MTTRTDATPRLMVLDVGAVTIAAARSLAVLTASLDAMHEAAVRTRNAMELAAPPIVEAFEAIRFERRHRTPPPFANPAKLARTERRRGRPGR